MDNTNVLLRIIEQLMENGCRVSDLASSLKISIGEIWSNIVILANSGLESKFQIEIYDGDKEIEDIYEPEGENIGEQYERIKNYEIFLYYTNDQVSNIDMLSGQERWSIYDVLNSCNDKFINFAAAKIDNFYDDEFKSDYNVISSRRIIRKNLKVFKNINPELLLELYDAMDNKYAVDLDINEKGYMNAVSPICIYYDDELEEWYLQYSRKRKLNIIRLNKISKLNKSSHPFHYMKPIKQQWGWGKEENIKFRLYDEKNARDVSSRYLSRKDIISIKKQKDYIELIVRVHDLNLFKRWARGMGPQAVVIEPEWLRDEIKKDIDIWLNNYNNALIKK